jgi:EAL domain-containing protein (putative c-di-GMP-specific phosphodiesterase class I)
LRLGEFIPLAEDSGLIVPIGRCVLREAGRLGHGSSGGRPPPLAIAVNLSARQLQHPGIVDEMAAALDAADLDPHSLVLEITETAVIDELDAAIRILTELRQLGVRLALDDFGTGNSSLSYLQRFPVDILKIDRAFVSGVAGSTEDSALAQAIVTLGQTLALETVAEGSRRPSSWPPCVSLAASSARATTSPNPSARQPWTPCSNATTPACIPSPHPPTKQCPDRNGWLFAALAVRR